MGKDDERKIIRMTLGATEIIFQDLHTSSTSYMHTMNTGKHFDSYYGFKMMIFVIMKSGEVVGGS